MQPVELPDKIHVGTVIDEGHSLASVSDKVAGIVLKRKITLGWVFGLLISFAVLQNLMAGATWLLIKGVGVWGINIPIGWGFAIINFVWWIGIGHAGTLISAIPQSAAVGRFRGFHISDHLRGVLVCRPDSGSRHTARFGEEPGLTSDLRDARDGLAQLGASLAAL
jgi:hypothetical protein